MFLMQEIWTPTSIKLFESWAEETLSPQLTRGDKLIKSAIDFIYAYVDAPLDKKNSQPRKLLIC